MKVSTAKRRINKTIDELFASLWDDFKDGYKRGYVDGYRHGLQGMEPKITEAEKVCETEWTGRSDDE